MPISESITSGKAKKRDTKGCFLQTTEHPRSGS